MAAVAGRAGVTRRAAYLHFGARAELIGALFDYVAHVEGLTESTQRVWDAPNAVAALVEWANHLARYHPRLLGVDRAVERMRWNDPDAAAHRKRVVAAKLANCRRLAGRLEHDGVLAAPWTVDSATDMLYALISSDMIEALRSDRRWSQRHLAEHLGLLFRATFVNERSPR